MKNKKLNIVLLTGANPFINAGILAFDSYKSLKNKGHSVFLLTPNYDPRLVDGMSSIYGKLGTYLRIFYYKVKRKMHNPKLDPTYYMHSPNQAEYHIPTKKILKLIPFQVDLFICLFPHRFLNARNWYELNKQTKAPICLMPVDMAEYTGGCHYANKCEGFKQHCGNCPGLYSNEDKDKTYKNLIIKKEYVSQTSLFISANTWTSNLIKQSTIFFGKPYYFSNLAIDETLYCPGNKKEAKDLFSIPSHKNIIFFGAVSIHEKRKGFSYFVEALNLLYEELDNKERDQIGIAIAGNINSEIKELIPFDIYFLGNLSHNQLPRAFQMADVFVSCSIQDAGPMMVSQSMMCGTPVVAFEMGNSVDFIVNSLTGYQAPLYNTFILKDGIRTIVMETENKKNRMSNQCRKLALSKSSYESFEQTLISNYNNFNSMYG